MKTIDSIESTVSQWDGAFPEGRSLRHDAEEIDHGFQGEQRGLSEAAAIPGTAEEGRPEGDRAFQVRPFRPAEDPAVPPQRFPQRTELPVRERQRKNDRK